MSSGAHCDEPFEPKNQNGRQYRGTRQCQIRSCHDGSVLRWKPHESCAASDWDPPGPVSNQRAEFHSARFQADLGLDWTGTGIWLLKNPATNAQKTLDVGASQQICDGRACEPALQRG